MNFFRLFTILLYSSLFFLSACGKDEKITKTDHISFEELHLNENGYFNGSDGSGGFKSGNAVFKINYSDIYKSWTGFALSSKTDTATYDYINQYSSIAGSGAGGSKQYAVLYSFSFDTIEFRNPAKITNISLSNSTLTYQSIKNGYNGCRKFGGESGNDKDYFYLWLSAIDAKGNKISFTQPVPLADFTFEDNSLDYISKSWEYYDLSSAGYIKYLIFSFSSSDTSKYGIITPTYVCIDNIVDEWEE